MTEQLLHLCNIDIPGRETHLSMLKLLPTLHQRTPSSLIIPLQASLTAALPTTSSEMSNHKPFPPNLVTFKGSASHLVPRIPGGV